MKKLVFEGEKIPKFYGRSYYDPIRNCWVCYLIPINVFVRMWMILKFMLRRGIFRTTIYEKELNNAYRKGFEEGKKKIDLEVYRKGLCEGFDMGMERYEMIFEKVISHRKKRKKK